MSLGWKREVSDAPAIRVLMVDDHALLRDGVATYLAPLDDIEIVGEASNGVEAIEAFRELAPDVTLMDLQMPVMDGLAAIAAIRADDPEARIVVLTTYEGDVQATRALKAGAVGYLLKSGLRRELADTIRKAHAGRRHVQPEIATAVALGALGEAITQRETEVLALVAEGCSNKVIAAKLGLSEETVKTYMRGILSKLGATDRTHAVTLAHRRGIIRL